MEAVDLTAGYAQLDTTPPLGCFPLAGDYDGGGCEPCSTRLARGSAEKIMAAGDELLDELKRQMD